MEKLPLYISIVFILATLLTLIIFYIASQSKIFLLISSGWLILQAVLGFSGFYKINDTTPPRFLLLALPPLAFAIAVLLTKKGNAFIKKLDMKTIVLVHVVRIAVEIVLFWLCIYKVVPRLMTFEGRNFDIFSGLTAPLIFYLGFVRNKISMNIILAWNFICLALLVNIVVIAVLSLPTTFQQLAFDQPNVAILYFPFLWLPCFIVPVVLFSHLVSIKFLLAKRQNELSIMRKSHLTAGIK